MEPAAPKALLVLIALSTPRPDLELPESPGHFLHHLLTFLPVLSAFSMHSKSWMIFSCTGHRQEGHGPAIRGTKGAKKPRSGVAQGVMGVLLKSPGIAPAQIFAYKFLGLMIITEFG
jgi:hypothetical protein